MPEISSRRSLTFIKLGGSLITDKTRPESVRTDVLERLAGELADGVRARVGGVVLGHGSGSFGHAVAKSHGFGGGEGFEVTPAAICAVQDAAARLHRRVVARLLAAGATPFSVVPGSAFVATNGQITQEKMELIERSIGSGCLPVLYGDLVLDRERVAAILSTETVFMGVIQSLLVSGWDVEQVVWLGETAGILDPSGQLVERVEVEDVEEIAKMVKGAAGIDVTGGMRHRLEAAVSLARLGVASRIADGRVPGLLKAALAGDEIHGTVIVPAARRAE